MAYNIDEKQNIRMRHGRNSKNITDIQKLILHKKDNLKIYQFSPEIVAWATRMPQDKETI